MFCSFAKSFSKIESFLYLNLSYRKAFFLGLFSFVLSPPFFFFPFFGISLSVVWLNAANEKKFLNSLKLLFLFYGGYFIGIFNWFLVPISIDVKNWLLIPFAIVGIAILFGGFCLLCNVLPFFLFRSWENLKSNNSKTENRIIHFALLIKQNEVVNAIIGYCWAVFGWFIADWARSKFLVGGMPWQTLALMFAMNNGTLNLIKNFNQSQLDFILSTIIALPILFRKNRKWGFLAICSVWLFALFLSFKPFVKNNSIDYNSDDIAGTGFEIVGIQGNISSRDSYDAPSSGYLKQVILQKYIGLAKYFVSEKKSIIVFPEGALTYYNLRDVERIGKKLQKLIPEEGGLVVFPSIVSDHNPELLYNALSVINSEGSLTFFAPKRYLVPFGEYVPFRWLLPKAFQSFMGLHDVISGDRGTSKHIWYKGVSIGFLICYEIIFDDKLLDTYGNKPDLIISVANDSWIGNSIGLYQHLAYVRLRAVLNKRPIFHISNDGPSILVDSNGRVVSRTLKGAISSLNAELFFKKELNEQARQPKSYFFKPK